MSISSVKTGAVGVSLLAGNAAFIPSNYESIATVSLSASQSSITFSSIPSTYTHLQLRGITRSTATGSGTEAHLITFNSDSGTNYSYHTLRGDGSATSSTGSASTSYMVCWGSPRAGDTANTFGASVIDILNYANTNTYKTLRGLGGIDTNTTVDYIILASGNWRSTSAVSTITLVPGAGSYAQYSHFALYGIKGA